MVYRVNGTDFLIEPTSGRWLPRNSFGVDGNGHPIYAPTRQFEVSFGMLTPTQQNQLQGFFDEVISTGTATVRLPEYGASAYIFENYSGCVLREPEQGQYFVENISDVRLLITNIVT